MSDYRLKCQVRNARLLRAIEGAGHRPGQKFADLVGLSYTGQLLPYVNLTRAPFDDDGNLRPCAEKLCVFFQCFPADLWSPEQCEPLVRNTAEVELTAAAVFQLCAPDPQVDPTLALEREQAREAVEALLATLPERQAAVLRLRFGFDGEALTLGETGQRLQLSRERVRTLEWRALRELQRRHSPARAIAREHYGLAD
ncbi:sigma-70 family RNA polymerase sigma factor [Methylolobus aquaticus]|nr:sigma-70 family RNA polymerase sigma factor [Methylolobus aquaticus]